jgi:hypothetical protein
LSTCGRLDELQLRLTQGMAKLGDGIHRVVEGNETRDPALLIALLNRGLDKYHLALETLSGIEEGILPIATVQAWRTEIVAIREQIIDTVSRFRQME